MHISEFCIRRPVFATVLSLLLIILPVIASVYGLLQAYMGREWELPFIAKYARRINL